MVLIGFRGVLLKISAMQILQRIREQKSEPDVNRLRKALTRGIPDRVPFMELFADGEIMSAILGKPINYFNRQTQNEQEQTNQLCFSKHLFSPSG